MDNREKIEEGLFNHAIEQGQKAAVEDGLDKIGMMPYRAKNELRIKRIHIDKLSGGTFCGDKRIDILDTVTYFEKEKCTCENCRGVLKRLVKESNDESTYL